MASKYIPQIILACTFTSVSIHLLNQRRECEEERRRFSTQVSALENVVHRQRAGEIVSDAEMAKIRRRVGLPDTQAVRTVAPTRIHWLPKREETPANENEVFVEWNKSTHFTWIKTFLDAFTVLEEAKTETSDSPSLLGALVPQHQPITTPVMGRKAENTILSKQGQESSKKPSFY